MYVDGVNVLVRRCNSCFHGVPVSLSIMVKNCVRNCFLIWEKVTEMFEYMVVECSSFPEKGSGKVSLLAQWVSGAIRHPVALS